MAFLLVQCIQCYLWINGKGERTLNFFSGYITWIIECFYMCIDGTVAGADDAGENKQADTKVDESEKPDDCCG